MVTIDPRIQGIQAGGGPSFGGPPDTLSPLAAGAAAGHLAASFLAKRDTNAHNRGVDAAKNHIIRSLGPLDLYKAKNILSPSFDSDYLHEVNSTLQREAERDEYSPANEKEELAYKTTLDQFRQSTMASGMAESIKAVREHQVNTLNSNIEAFTDAYVSAETNKDAIAVGDHMFKAYYEASRTDQRYPGIMTREEATRRYESDMRQAAISRLMVNSSALELYQVGNDNQAHVMIPDAGFAMTGNGNPPETLKASPLSIKEKQAIIKFALDKQQQDLHIQENARKISEEKYTLMKSGVEREVVDGILATRGTMGPELLAKMQGLVRDDGTPLFTASEVEHISKFIHDQQKQAAEPPVSSDPAVYAKYFRQIFPTNKSGGKNFSNFALPDIRQIQADPNLTQSHKDSFISHIVAERNLRTNRDFGDFHERRSQGHSLLKSSIGGDSLVEMNDATKNFWGILENTYYARINQAYDEALRRGDGLRTINPQAIVNQIIRENAGAMEKVFFREVNEQMKALSPYIERIPANIAGTADIGVVVKEITKDMMTPGSTGRKRLAMEEGARLLSLATALQRSGKTVQDLRDALGNETIVFDEKKGVTSNGWLYPYLQSFRQSFQFMTDPAKR